MTGTLRGADIVARSLKHLGCHRVFTLSGNHIMSIFDAALDADLDLVHVRHEAAAVHMADAHGRLTGEAALRSSPAAPAMPTPSVPSSPRLAQIADGALVRPCRHWELGRGGFQELRQADMAASVTRRRGRQARPRRSAATSARRSASPLRGGPGRYT